MRDSLVHEFFHPKHGKARRVGLKRVKYPRTFPLPEGLEKESPAVDAHPGAGRCHRGAPTECAAVLPCTSTATTHRITELEGLEGPPADHLVHY